MINPFKRKQSPTPEPATMAKGVPSENDQPEVQFFAARAYDDKHEEIPNHWVIGFCIGDAVGPHILVTRDSLLSLAETIMQKAAHS